MSPVWVKLGDFGVSKRIQAQATTTLHTQVSTRVYGAPEVLGLDSNSETSEYTNSVDIWSLGCVIYELLVGTKLFASEGQVSRYFFGKWPFPQDKLKGLSPTDDVGITLLKSMLSIQPEDRPTAVDALSHVWLVRPKRQNENHRDLALGDNGGFQRCGSAVLEPIIDTSGMIRFGAASVQNSEIQVELLKSEPMHHGFEATHSNGSHALGKQQIGNIPHSSPKSSTPNTQLNLHIKHVANESWMLDHRPPASDLPKPNTDRGNVL